MDRYGGLWSWWHSGLGLSFGGGSGGLGWVWG